MMKYDTENEMFQLAIQLVNQSNRNIFLTGKAGTGKTTFLKYIRENCPKQLAVVAPTGVAAINAGGVTIHSFFQLPLAPFIPATNGTGKIIRPHHQILSLLMNALLKIHPEVQEALTNNKPVVALESTIISHGMPYPKNVETALAVEEVVRANGAVPATIAIFNGKCLSLIHI